MVARYEPKEQDIWSFKQEEVCVGTSEVSSNKKCVAKFGYKWLSSLVYPCIRWWAWEVSFLFIFGTTMEAYIVIDLAKYVIATLHQSPGWMYPDRTSRKIIKPSFSFHNWVTVSYGQVWSIGIATLFKSHTMSLLNIRDTLSHTHTFTFTLTLTLTHTQSQTHSLWGNGASFSLLITAQNNFPSILQQ